MESTRNFGSQQFYHGTKADLKLGEHIEPSFITNYDNRKKQLMSI